MTVVNKLIVLATLGLCTAAANLTSAAVAGRFIRIEAPASRRMGLHEIEVWSGGANIALKNKQLKFAGLGYKGSDINERNRAWQLVDGVAEYGQRGVEPGLADDARGVDPWVELDLGTERPLERVVVKSTLKPVFSDRGLRLVSVLDAQRRVVWTGSYDIRHKPFDSGVATFELGAGGGRLAGRVVPPNTGQWAPLGDVLEAQPALAPTDATARAARFAERNSPAAIERLTREFFARVDLAKPELAGVKAKFEKGEFAAALDAYRDHFLKKLQGVTFLHEHPPVVGSYDLAGDDLMRNVAVVFSRSDVQAQQIRPGSIDWAATGGEDKEDDSGEVNDGVATARVRALAGQLQSPLLLAYQKTGRADYLAQWSAITDDWGMNIRADLARAKADLRDYFVKDPLQEFNHLADALAQTAKQRPEFAGQLSGATLARLLMPVLEEYPPAYWWVCRRASFNHTYNALTAASITSRILDDFHAGERLDKENREHWERVWTSNMTRDGSMNEIGDEGHMFMQLRMGAFFSLMKEKPPPWFTPDRVPEFDTGWRMTTVYPIRHLSPDGRGHRFTRKDHFGPIWVLTGSGDMDGEGIPVKREAGGLSSGREMYDSATIMRQPGVAGIMQTVFGAGRDPATLPPKWKEYRDKVIGFYGKTFTPPSATSDWMPYAGLWYLRRSWEPDASFIHMLCQPKGHPGVNGSDWDTEVHYFDFGVPLLALSPVWIDGQPPFNEAGTLTYKPGSKTSSLATASEFPIPARWHSSALLDYAESFYEGTYQDHQVQSRKDFRPRSPVLGSSPVVGARADRRVILFRPARLVVVTDAVRVPSGAKPHVFEVRQRFALPEVNGEPVEKPGKFVGNAANLALVNDDHPGVTVRRFTGAKLEWDKRQTPDGWEHGASMMSHAGALERLGGILRAETKGNLLMSALIEPNRRAGDSMVKTATDLTAQGVTGFRATLGDGSTLTWLATLGETHPLAADALAIEGDGLLVWNSKEGTRGLVLGAKSLRVEGRQVELPASDFEFTLKDGRLASSTPIHRPIQPVTFSPQETVFTDTASVTLSSTTPGVEIRYTLDGSEPAPASTLYTVPLALTKDSYIRARAFRPGVRAIPFTVAGTDVTVVSEARYYRRDLKPAVVPRAVPAPGLRWEMVESDWFGLFSHLNLPDVMPAKASGDTRKLLDVSMRKGEGPFGVRYQGLIEVPADGVWTFHAPPEYVGASCEPGYDLRVWIDGQEWDLGMRFHGRGLWSAPLAKGPHRLLVTFADARSRDRTVHKADLWGGYPSPWVVWKGEAPVIEVSGPNFKKQPIPSAWLQNDVR